MNVVLVNTEKVLYLVNLFNNLEMEWQVMSQLTNLLLRQAKFANTLEDHEYYWERLQEHKKSLTLLQNRMAAVNKELTAILP